jgi:alpha-galactosidase
MTGRARHEVAEVTVEPARARLYAEGWQSWSVTEEVPATDVPYRVRAPASVVINCQYRAPAPERAHQGAGLLAVDPGNGGPVRLFAAPDAAHFLPVIQARLRGSTLSITSDGQVADVADSGPGGLNGSLGRWGQRFAASAGLRPDGLRPIPAVWCSWYQYYQDVSDEAVLANLTAIDRRDIPIGVVQIDDGYAPAPGDWLAPTTRFPDLRDLIRRITGSGKRAGIWIAPALVGLASELYSAHPDWVVRDAESGEPVWAGDVCRQHCAALDVTHPDAAAYLASVLATMGTWGIDYFKIDFLYAGAFEGRRREQTTGVEAYRELLRQIRAAIGPAPLLVGCGAPVLPSVGLVDAMRVGPDVAARYEATGADPSMPSQRNATRNTIARAWQHGRFWVNDPDCLMARPGVERREDWAQLIERYGGLRASGDAIDLLDDWGLQTTRRLLRPATTVPFG